jgi:cytochrome c oxidase cbb3-type subunit 3
VSDRGYPAVPGTAPTEVDVATGTETTGHEWDGIKELNTPLPRWWLWIFYVTHIWALGYIILYPAIPLFNDATSGLLGWNSRAEVETEMSDVELGRADIMARIRDEPLKAIVEDEGLRTASFRGGESAFKVNCVQCHGADAAGSAGFANLNDDDWIWGGTVEDIHTTIVHGVRFAGDPDTRISDMPAFGRDGMLDRTQIEQTTQFVLALSGQPHDAAVAEAGAPLFADNCAVCHGEAGEGNRELGAPQLNDAIWLYSGDTESIRRQIHTPRHGVMPAWGQRLDPTTIKQLSVYVHGLGGGEAMPEIAAEATAEPVPSN